MSNVAKWVLLASGAALLIALVFALPVADYIDLSEFSAQLSVIVMQCGNFFVSARGLINSFLSPFGRVVLTGLLGWLFGKWALMITIKIVTWAYHFIFKG